MKTINFDELYSDKSQIVLVLGYFDVFHLGHKALLEYAKKEAKKLNAIFAVFTFSNDISSYTDKTEPIYNFEKRKKLFALLGVQLLITAKMDQSFKSMSASEFSAKLKKKYNIKEIVVGMDFKFGKNRESDFNVLREEEFVVKVMSLLKDKHDNIINTTDIKKLIKSGNIKEANEQLTFTYSVIIRNCIEGSNGEILADIDTNLKNGNYICALECYDKHSSEFPCTIKDSKVLFKKSVLGGIIANNKLDDAELYILREVNRKEKNS